MSEGSGRSQSRLISDHESSPDEAVSSKAFRISTRGSAATAPSTGTLEKKSLPRFIAQRLARADYASVATALQFLPLTFRSPIDESNYFRHLLGAHVVRAHIITLITVFMTIIFWVGTGLSIAYGLYATPNSDARWLFHVVMAVLCMCSATYWSLSLMKWFHCYLEVGLYCLVATVGLGSLVWIVICSIQFDVVTPIDVLRMDQFKLWTTPMVLGLPLWDYILLNVFMQTRTRRSFFPQIIILVLRLTLNGISAYELTIHQEVSDVEFVNQTFFYTIVTALELISLTCSFLMCYFGRWNLELQERIEFWKFSKSKTQLEELRAAQKKRKAKSGSTAVEDLLHIITRATASIHETEVTTGNETLVECTEILRQIQDILTNTDNLYAVQLQAKSMTGEETPADAETAQLEAKFYEIYATQARGALPHRQKQPSVQLTDGGAASTTLGNYKLRNLAPPPRATAEFRHLVGREWNCNILRAATEYSHIVVEVGALLLEPRSQDLDTSPVCIRNFAYRIERLYRPNPYHNAAHAAMVAHAMSCLIRMLEIHMAPLFAPLDFVVAIVAALGHDTGHPGRNNNFYTASFERMRTFTPRLCFEAWNPTDMSQHFESVSKFRLRRQAAGFNYLGDNDDMWLVLRMCMKCADLSHALVDWSQHQQWSLRVVEEFYQQGDEEASLGLPKSPLCDRSRHHDFAKSQKGFIEFVVQPLCSQIDEMDYRERVADQCLKHLTYNKYKWEEMSREKKTVPIPSEVSQATTDSSSCRFLLMHLLVPPRYRLVSDEDGGEGKDKALRRTRSLRFSSPRTDTAGGTQQEHSTEEFFADEEKDAFGDGDDDMEDYYDEYDEEEEEEDEEDGRREVDWGEQEEEEFQEDEERDAAVQEENDQEEDEQEEEEEQEGGEEEEQGGGDPGTLDGNADDGGEVYLFEGHEKETVCGYQENRHVHEKTLQAEEDEGEDADAGEEFGTDQPRTDRRSATMETARFGSESFEEIFGEDAQRDDADLDAEEYQEYEAVPSGEVDASFWSDEDAADVNEPDNTVIRRGSRDLTLVPMTAAADDDDDEQRVPRTETLRLPSEQLPETQLSEAIASTRQQRPEDPSPPPVEVPAPSHDVANYHKLVDAQGRERLVKPYSGGFRPISNGEFREVLESPYY